MTFVVSLRQYSNCIIISNLDYSHKSRGVTCWIPVARKARAATNPSQLNSKGLDTC